LEEENYEFLRKYILYCKRFNPQFSPEARLMIVKYFTDIMTSKDTNNLASPRLLETLNNLCFAVARLKQKEIIDVDDVKEVTAFYGVQLKSLCMTIEEGLDFIERHLTSPIYPRRISTRTTKDGQILVKNREQALARFQQSNLLDCRISAYPFPVPEYKGLNRQPPNFLLSDLDQKAQHSMVTQRLLDISYSGKKQRGFKQTARGT
jgi:DNA replicative helicase MCM subunit Mcm2 (Cdc46/Mcm family)